MILPKLKTIEKLAVDNSPALLTAVGVVGTLTTAVLTHKAATKAERILAEEQHKLNKSTILAIKPQLDRRESFNLVWKLYIPPVICGSLTIAAIVGSNRIGSKRTAAVAAAYTISEKAYSEYRDKVAERFGASKAQDVYDDVARDHLQKNPPQESNVVLVGSGEVLCCDLFSGRYFNSSVEELKKAQNDTNYQVLNHGYASLTDFYDRVGLPRTDQSEEVGWNMDKLLELTFSTLLTEDGRPCVAFRFDVQPIRGYHHLS